MPSSLAVAPFILLPCVPLVIPRGPLLVPRLLFTCFPKQGTVMNRIFDRMVSLCGMSFLFAAACLAQLVRAQDELPCPPPVGGRVIFGDHPILSKLPLAPDYL